MIDVETAETTLLDIGRILDEAAVPFFLVLGTCLGVVRDGRLIRHDTDIDIGCLLEDLQDKALGLVADFREAGFSAKATSTPFPRPRALVVSRDGIKADIAGLARFKHVRYSPSTFQDYCIVYPAEIIETTEDVEYLGRTWRVPSPSHFYLEKHYGPGWRKPDPNYKPTMGKARVYGFLKRVC